MNPVAKLAAFTLALVIVFGAGLGIGRAVGPLDDRPSTQMDQQMDMGR